MVSALQEEKECVVPWLQQHQLITAPLITLRRGLHVTFCFITNLLNSSPSLKVT